MRNKGGILLLTILLILSIPFVAFAEEVLPELKIIQSCVDQDGFRVYFDVSDEQSNNIKVKYDELNIRITDEENKEVDFYCDGIQKNDKDGIAYVLAVDISTSNRKFSQMQKSMIDFVETINEQDEIAIISFGDSVNKLLDFTYEKDEIKEAIESIKCTDRWTKLYGGIDSAINLLEFSIGIPDRKSIIVYSDGFNYDEGGESSARDIMDSLQNSPKVIPIYAVQFDANKDKYDIERIREFSEIIKTSNGEFITLAGKGIDECYSEIYDNIAEQYYMDFEMNAPAGKYTIYLDMIYQDFKLEDSLRCNINLNLESDNISLQEKDTELSPTPTPLVETATEEKAVEVNLVENPIQYAKNNLLITAVAAGAILLIILIIIIAVLKKKRYRPVYSMGTSKNSSSKSVYLKPFETEDFQGIAINIDSQIVIGSNKKACDVSYGSQDQVKPQHFVLQLEGDRLYIFNVKSEYETYVNGMKLESKREVRNNDVISFGEAEIQLVF